MKFFLLIPFLFIAFPSAAQKGGEDDLSLFRSTRKTSVRFDESKRAVSVLGGLALLNKDPGYYIEGGIRYEPGAIGFGVFSSFLRVPKQEFSNWTILATQISVTPQIGFVNPYFTFDYGLANAQLIGDKFNFRTCTLELGGGIESKFANWVSFLVDFRWKRFLDYGGERTPFNSWVINAGLKFKRQSISSRR